MHRVSLLGERSSSAVPNQFVGGCFCVLIITIRAIAIVLYRLSSGVTGGSTVSLFIVHSLQFIANGYSAMTEW